MATATPSPSPLQTTTPVQIQFSCFMGGPTSGSVTIDPDCDLVWGIDLAQGFSLPKPEIENQGPTSTFGLQSLNITSKEIAFTAYNSSAPLLINILLVGDASSIFGGTFISSPLGVQLTIIFPNNRFVPIPTPGHFNILSVSNPACLPY